jgi:hypothetical protein
MSLVVVNSYDRRDEHQTRHCPDDVNGWRHC